MYFAAVVEMGNGGAWFKHRRVRWEVRALIPETILLNFFLYSIPVHDPNTELSPERKLPASLSNDELDEARVPSSGKLAHEASTVR